MRTYVLDQLIFLLVAIIIMLIVPRMCGGVLLLTIISELMVLISSVYLCRQVFLLAIDSFLEKKVEELHFSKICNISRYEFSKRKCYCEWILYSSTKTLKLVVPMEVSEKEVNNIEHPKQNQRIRVTYFRFSKILSSWEFI